MNELAIYPNPTERFVHVSTNQEYELLSDQGVLLEKGEGKSVDLTGYSSGGYFLKIEDELHRVVKQ